MGRAYTRHHWGEEREESVCGRVVLIKPLLLIKEKNEKYMVAKKAYAFYIEQPIVNVLFFTIS
jgi:hypothetical protein